MLKITKIDFEMEPIYIKTPSNQIIECFLLDYEKGENQKIQNNAIEVELPKFSRLNYFDLNNGNFLVSPPHKQFMILVKNLNDLHSLIYGNNYSGFVILRDKFNRINYTYHVYDNDFLNNKQYKIDEKYTDGEEKAYFFKDGTVGFFVKNK
jgi:hypothetical protein